MKTKKIINQYFFIACFICAIVSCRLSNQGMSANEYYDYLRSDTTICHIPALYFESFFENTLDSIIKSWESCRICKEDPHPFVFEITEKILGGDTLVYSIITNPSPILIHPHYLGAFEYGGYTFVVLEMSTRKSSFVSDEKNKSTPIYFCNRAHSTECGLLIKITLFNESYNVTSVECKKRKIITVR